MPYSSLSLGECVKPFTPEKAKEIIMSLQQPAIFCNMVFDWPAQHWTAEHLSRVLQGKQIRFRMGLRSTDTGSKLSLWKPRPLSGTPTLSAIPTPSLDSPLCLIANPLTTRYMNRKLTRKHGEIVGPHTGCPPFKQLGLNTHTKCKSVYSCIPHVARHYYG